MQTTFHFPLRHLDAFQFCRAEDSAKMEALEEVDGVSETIMAQGQVIPSDTIAAGKLTMALYQPLRMRSVVMSSNTSARHPACVQPLSTCSCNLKAGHEVYAVWQGTWQADLTFFVSGMRRCCIKRAFMSGQARCSAGYWTTAGRCLFWSKQRSAW